MLKVKTRSNTVSDTLTRDPTRAVKIVDPVTRSRFPETRLHLWWQDKRDDRADKQRSTVTFLHLPVCTSTTQSYINLIMRSNLLIYR